MTTRASSSAIGPRWPTGPGHIKAEEFLRAYSSAITISLKRTRSPPTRPSARCRCELHRALSRQKKRRHRPRHPLRDQLSAPQHRLCGRQRRRFDHRPADGHRRPAPRRSRSARIRSSTATRSGWSSSTAKRPSTPGPAPTPPMAAATLPPAGDGMERSARSRPSCWPT